MNIHPLVFSNKKNFRIMRHTIFWLMWIAYYTGVVNYGLYDKIPLKNRFLFALSETTLTTPVDMAFCYSIIYFLIPRLLFNGKYISMILLWLLFSLIFIGVFILITGQTDPLLRTFFGLPIPKGREDYFWLSFSLFSQINMEGCVAASIKLGKISFINRQENKLLKNEKEKLQLKTGNAEIQPTFLADIFERVEKMQQKAIDMPSIIKRISGIITHIFYENPNGKITIKRELELIQEYIELEKYTSEDVIGINLNISDLDESESIASFILLQFVQNAFNQLHQSDVSNKKMYIDIRIINRVLTALISWNKPLYSSTLLERKYIILHNLSNRLKLIYPESHEIKILIEVEKIIASLKIDLKGAIN